MSPPNRQRDKGPRGQVIQTDFPHDASSHTLPNAMNSTFNGGDDNLAHSITGGSVRSRADGTGSGADKKDTFS